MADGLPPNRTLLGQALKLLEGEEFTEFIKLQLKGELTELEFQTGDVEQIARQIADYRIQAQALDTFMEKLREYVK